MFSVVVLAGGFSSRMKTPKFLLKFKKATTFIEEIVQKYICHEQCKELVIVVNHQHASLLNSYSFVYDNMKVVLNKHPEKGRFYSIQSGLKVLKKVEQVFLHNVDNPFVVHKTLNNLIQRINNHDFAVPTYNNKGGHPVLLSKKIVRDIIIEKNSEQNLRLYLKKYNRLNVSVSDENILININTPQDYKLMFY